MHSKQAEYTFAEVRRENTHCVVPRVYLPPLRFQPYLDAYVVTELTSTPASSGRARRMPEGASYISFLRGRKSASGVSDDAVLVVGGAQEHVHDIPVWDYQFQCALRIKPGAAALILGPTVPLLTNAIVPLRDLWGERADCLFEQLVAARSDADHIRAISSAVEDVICERAFSAPLSVRLANAVRCAGGNVRISQLAKDLGTTVRTLERRFKEEVGLTPKRYQRISRLAKVVGMLGDTEDWARIAAECGFYDQSHLIDDCQEVLGDSPERFSRNVASKEALRIGLVFERNRGAQF